MAVVQQRNSEMVNLLTADLLSNRHMNLCICVGSPQVGFTGSYVTVDFDTESFNSTTDLFGFDNAGNITIKKKGIYLCFVSMTVRNSQAIPTDQTRFSFGYDLDEGSGFIGVNTMAIQGIPADSITLYANASAMQPLWIETDNTILRIRVRRDAGTDPMQVDITSHLTLTCLMMLD